MLFHRGQRAAIAILLLGQLACTRARKVPALDFRDLNVQGPTRVQKLGEFDDGYRYVVPTDNLLYIFDVSVDSSGRIYGSGNDSSNPRNGRIRRYDASRFGLDSTFNVTITLNTQQTTPYAARVLGTDQLYIAGRTLNALWEGFAQRVLSNGALDTAFYTIGRRITDFTGNTGYDFLRDAVVQSDGKLVVAGYSVTGGSARGLLARFCSNGSYDTEFATQGYAFYTVPGGQSIFFRMTQDTAGNFLPVGVYGTGNGGQATLWKISSDGQLNTSFNTVGYRVVPQGWQSHGYSALLGTDNTLYLSGTYADGNQRGMVLVRMLSDGSFDTSYNTTGKVVRTESVTTMPWHAPAALTDYGKVMVAWGKGIARFTSNGQIDSSFGSTGITVGSYDPQAIAFSTSGATWVGYSSYGMFAVASPLVTPAIGEGLFINTPVAGSSINFGYVPALTGTTTRLIRLTNNGALVSEDALSLAQQGSLTAPFLFEGGYPGTGGTCGSSLAVAASCDLVVTMTTAAHGRHNDTLRIGWVYDGITRTLNIPLTGAASNLSVTNFPTYYLGTGAADCQVVSGNFTVTNNGATPITLTTESGCNSASGNTGWSISSDTCLASVGAGQTCSFTANAQNQHTDCWQSTQPIYDEECRLEIHDGADEGVTLILQALLK